MIIQEQSYHFCLARLGAATKFNRQVIFACLIQKSYDNFNNI